MKRQIIVMAALLSGLFSLAESRPIEPHHVRNVTAIDEVFGDGQKVSAVAVEYDRAIRTHALKASDFKVEGRQVRRVYASRIAAKRSRGVNGRFVIVELTTPMSSNRMPGQMGSQPGPGPANAGSGPPPGGGGPKLGEPATDSSTPKRLTVKLTQTGTVITSGGIVYGPSSEAMSNTKNIDLVVRDFHQFVYHDVKFGGTNLMYNLFVPRNFDPRKRYPLVLFIHDAGVVSNDPKATLTQGLGAVVWASPSEQAKRECFVLAPQFQSVIVDDRNTTTRPIDVTVDLVKSLESRFPIDKNKIYNTGQSMGGMASIAMDIKYPRMFAASFLVACQWNAAEVVPMAKQHLWILVSQGDSKAHPGMDAITAVLKEHGAKMSRGMCVAESSESVLDRFVANLWAKRCNVNYMMFKNGNHPYTWRYAYSIPEIRRWLFAQKRNGGGKFRVRSRS